MLLKSTPANQSICLLFLRDEVYDFVLHNSESYAKAQPFSPSPESVEYISELTQGHAIASACELKLRHS